MTVKELKEMLSDIPDDMFVYILGDSALGGFKFLAACTCDSGVIQLDAANEKEYGFDEGAMIFVLMPHGSIIAEDELDEEGDDKLPPEVFN